MQGSLVIDVFFYNSMEKSGSVMNNNVHLKICDKMKVLSVKVLNIQENEYLLYL